MQLIDMKEIIRNKAMNFLPFAFILPLFNESPLLLGNNIRKLVSNSQVLIIAMNQKLKLSVLSWFYSMVAKPPGLELSAKGVERKKRMTFLFRSV